MLGVKLLRPVMYNKIRKKYEHGEDYGRLCSFTDALMTSYWIFIYKETLFVFD